MRRHGGVGRGVQPPQGAVSTASSFRQLNHPKDPPPIFRATEFLFCNRSVPSGQLLPLGSHPPSSALSPPASTQVATQGSVQRPRRGSLFPDPASPADVGIAIAVVIERPTCPCCRGERPRPVEVLIAARRLAVARPHLAALASIVHHEDLWLLCRDELTGLDVRIDGWEIRGRWVRRRGRGHAADRGAATRRDDPMAGNRRPDRTA